VLCYLKVKVYQTETHSYLADENLMYHFQLPTAIVCAIDLYFT
jgi:hypothetical protein